jgi:hypothetical protein
MLTFRESPAMLTFRESPAMASKKPGPAPGGSPQKQNKHGDGPFSEMVVKYEAQRLIRFARCLSAAMRRPAPAARSRQSRSAEPARLTRGRMHHVLWRPCSARVLVLQD